MADEFERIASLHALFGDAPERVRLGIGDDAAVLESPPGAQLVWTIDACVENVHFRRDIASWEDVGVRSLMAAASDLAAMAARPMGALSSLTLPREISDDELLGLARGQQMAASEIASAVVGGNLARGDAVEVHTTLLGWSRAPVRRDGARPGDVVALCGEVGLAAAGLRLLLRDPGFVPRNDDENAALLAWRRPRARIEDGWRCGPVATSLIDLSDGLAQDASHIAEASGVRIDLEPVVTDALRHVAGLLEEDPEHLALHGGEDYALLGTFPPGCVPEGFVVVGACSAGKGVWVQGREVARAGHDHFR